MRTVVAGATAILALAGLGACVGDAPSTPPPDSGSVDAPIADAPITDTGSDVLDSGPPTWCTGRPEKFCWDFDRPVFDEGWTRKEVNGALSQSLDARSSPKAMQALALPGPPNPYVALSRSIGSSPTKTRAGVDVKRLDGLADAGADAGSTFLNLQLVYVSPTGIAYLYFTGSETRIGINTVGVTATVGPPPPLNVWVRYEWEITWAPGGAGALTAWVDGVKVVDQSSISTLDSNPLTNVVLEVGLRGPAVSSTRVLFDNVTLTD